MRMKPEKLCNIKNKARYEHKNIYRSKSSNAITR